MAGSPAGVLLPKTRPNWGPLACESRAIARFLAVTVQRVQSGEGGELAAVFGRCDPSWRLERGRHSLHLGDALPDITLLLPSLCGLLSFLGLSLDACHGDLSLTSTFRVCAACCRRLDPRQSLC